MGMISRSKSREAADQQPWYTQNGRRPWLRAYSLALLQGSQLLRVTCPSEFGHSYLTTHAGVSLMPRYKTLPLTTRWFNDCMSSGIEVL